MELEFSIILEAQLADPAPAKEFKLFHDCVDQVLLAEEMGFDRVWAVEHHSLRQYAHMSAPETFLAYVAGRTDTLAGLVRTLEHLGLGLEHIAEIKCFLDPMTEIELVDEQIAAFFGDAPVPPVSHVEWIAGSLPIEIELVAYAPAEKSFDTIKISTPPWMKSSPVFSRVTRLYGNERIYLSGLYSSKDGDGESQVRDIFASMRTTLAETGSDFRHLAKATYYVSADDSSAKLNEVRPTIYDPSRPPSASKAKVKGVARTSR